MDTEIPAAAQSGGSVRSMMEQDRSHSVRRARLGDVSRAPGISGRQDELRGSATVRRCSSRGVPIWSGDAAGHARDPYLAVVFAGADPGDDRFRDPLPRRLTGLRKRATASETCSLTISQYCAGEAVTSSTPTSHSATSTSPAAWYRALTYPGAAHRNIPGPSGPGGASTSAAMACMAIVVHGFSPGPAHTTSKHARPA